MARGRIQGITIEIGGDTTKLQTALKGVDSQLKQTQSSLRDIDKLLKLNPGNTELLTQKQKNLEKSVKLTKERLEELRKAQSNVQEGTAQWDALQREIIDTENKLESLEQEYKEFGSVTAQQVKVVGEKMQEVGGKIQGVGEALAPVSKAAAAVGAALLGAGYKAVTTADDLNTLAKQTGLTTDDLQKMKYASDLIDVSFESITGATKKLKKSMTGHDKTWEKLGVSVKDADGNMRNIRDVFNDTIKALSKVSNETERDQLAMDLFGKSADELAGVIDDGGAALKEYGDEAENLGLVLSGDTLNSLNQTNDAIDKMKAQLGGAFIELGAQVATVLAPSIEKLAGFVQSLTEKLKQLTPEQTETILKVIALVAAISPLLIIGGKLIIGIGMLLTYAPAIAAAFAAVNVAIIPIIATIAAVIAIGVLLIKNWDKIKAYAEKVFKKVSDGWNKLKQTVTKNAQDMKNGLANAWNLIKTTVTGAMDAVKNGVTTKLTAIKTGFTEGMSTIKTKVSEGLTNVKEAFTEKMESAKEKVSSLISTTKENFNDAVGNMKEYASEKVGAIKEKFSDAFGDIKSSVKDKIGDAYDSLRNKVNNMVEKVENGVSKLKKAFKFKWKLPKIKLPHFNISGGEPPYGLGGKGSLPKFSIDWYRKAYENPMLFTSPTVLSTPNGLKGFGDGNGGELIYGHDQLMRDIARASSGEVTINIYASQGMNVNQLADKVQARLVQLQKQKGAAYA